LPQPKVSQVRSMLKFDRVGPDKKSDKFDSVDPRDTHFKKINLNFFYKKWILDFELNPNIGSRFKS